MDEILVVDAGVKISDLQEAEYLVLRAAFSNQLYGATGSPPGHAGKGRKPVDGLAHSAFGTPLQEEYPGEIVPRPGRNLERSQRSDACGNLGRLLCYRM